MLQAWIDAITGPRVMLPEGGCKAVLQAWIDAITDPKVMLSGGLVSVVLFVLGLLLGNLRCEKRIGAVGGGDAAGRNIDKSQTVNNYGVSQDRFEELNAELAVIEAALATFFRIMGEAQVPHHFDLDAKLREVAGRHKDLLAHLNALSSDDPEVIVLKTAAKDAIERGDYAAADANLEQARDLDLDLANIVAWKEMAQRLAEAIHARRLSAAESEAERGQIAATRLNHAAGAEHYRAAADLLPENEQALRAEYLNTAGVFLLDLARNSEAEPLFEQALALREELHGPDHPDVAIGLNNLAQLIKATNRLTEAEPLMRRALEIDEAALGPDHPSVARDLNNLARLLHDTSRPTEAEYLMRRALEIDEAALGPDHPNVARDLNNLAQILHDTDRLAEAEPLMRRALEIDEAALGPDHRNVARDLNSLARLFRDTKRLAEAEPLLERAVAILDESLGADHPRSRTVAHNLAALRSELAAE